MAEQEYKNAEDYEKTEIAKYSNLVDMFTNSNRNTGNGVKMTSPKLLCSASLPGTSENNRSAGTYKASSDSYNTTIYLEENDIIDFEHKTTMSSNWNNASFKIYTMTQ